MRRSSSQSNQPDRQHLYWTMGVLAACGVLLLAALTLNSPAASWISDAAQAEFVGTVFTPEQAPVQTANRQINSNR
ncbi:hypothetical protein [uncultured Bradyrhizobium sp.]|uniref:hypothetical protein n=1 Tax=uncultured Bradyrhizobium sp. TaxID=199684 RepID=UPI0035CB057B